MKMSCYVFSFVFSVVSSASSNRKAKSGRGATEFWSGDERKKGHRAIFNRFAMPLQNGRLIRAQYEDV